MVNSNRVQLGMKRIYKVEGQGGESIKCYCSFKVDLKQKIVIFDKWMRKIVEFVTEKLIISKILKSILHFNLRIHSFNVSKEVLQSELELKASKCSFNVSGNPSASWFFSSLRCPSWKVTIKINFNQSQYIIVSIWKQIFPSCSESQNTSFRLD